VSTLTTTILCLVALSPGCGIGALVIDGSDAGDAASFPTFPPAPLPALEPSNGLDDDGDGLVDEDATLTPYRCADPSRCTCALTHTRCGDLCAPHSVDPENCGACGHACRAGDTCRGGTCFCGSGFDVRCGSVCTNLQGDRQNCGACGRVCAGGQDCAGGRCQCAAGFVPDFGRCHANGGSGLYCGASGCPVGYGCHGTQCLCACGTICPDFTSDPNNCGECRTQCSAGTPCIGGRCGCTAPRAVCDRACVDLRADPRHCGACGRVCNATQRCFDGACRTRLGTPASGERVGSGRVALRWPGGQGVADVCADRACARVLETVAPSGGVASTGPLTAGTYFWRVRADGAGPSRPVPFRVDRRSSPRVGLLPPSPDLNGDGLGDIVVATEAEVRVYLGAPAPAPLGVGPRLTLPSPRIDVEPRIADDWGVDGVGDVFLTHMEVEVMSMDAVGALATMPLRGWRSQTQPLLDVDEDAWPDAATVTPTPYLHYGAAAAPTPLMDFLRSPAAVAPVGDVNGDTFRDVAFASSSPAFSRVYVDTQDVGPRAVVYLGGPGGLTRSLQVPTPAPGGAFPMGAASAGDVKGDGFADVLIDVGGVNVVVYLGGASALTRHRTLVTPARTTIVAGAAGDVDGDGDGDLLVVPRGVGELWLYRGSAAGLVAAPEVFRDPRWAAVEAVGVPRDVDGDGFDDVVLGAPARGAVYVLRGAAVRPLERVEALTAFAAPSPRLRVL
jgi:hypothetical protein